MKQEKITNDQVKVLLTEYETCKDKVNMYSSLMWQTGAIFLAGTFVLLGIVVSVWGKLPPWIHSTVVCLLAFVSGFTLLFWRFRLYQRYRWYNTLALLRSRAIEKYLVDNFDAKDELEWEGISTKIIENWITEKDNKLNDPNKKKDFLEELNRDLENPPKKVHNWITYLIGFIIAIWIIMFVSPIIPEVLVLVN